MATCADAQQRQEHICRLPRSGIAVHGHGRSMDGHPAGSAVLDEASETHGPRRRRRLPGRGVARHDRVRPARACSACAIAAFRVLEAEGTAFGGVAGHSLGEFAALVAADVIGLSDALDVVVVRGRAMQRAGEERPGTMTALLGVDAATAASLCDEARGDDVLVVANENSPVQVVISGSIPAIERAEAMAKERKIRAVRLNVAGAFHSALMEPAIVADRRTSRRRSSSGRRASRSPRTSRERWSTIRRSCARSSAGTSSRPSVGSRACIRCRTRAPSCSWRQDRATC